MVTYLDKLARPILSNMAQVAYLEAFGRIMCDIAPWLNGEGLRVLQCRDIQLDIVFGNDRGIFLQIQYRL